MRVGARDISMARGWIVQFKDGSVICEDDMAWLKVPNKKNIRRMILKYDDRLWDLCDKEHYISPNKRGYIDVNVGGTSQGVDSRTIGYYDLEEKCKVILRVEEATGRMKYDVEPFK